MRKNKIIKGLVALLIIGGVSEIYASAESISTENWMSKIDSSTYISEISIPGTYDSGALHETIKNTAKCQNLNLDNQLSIGVRYLDIRCRSVNNSFQIYHGPENQFLSFDDVISSCIEFLKNNPSETIVMSVKEEYNSLGSSKSFEDIFMNYLEKNKDLWLLNSKIPTLGEARGKIVLIRRFKTDENSIGIDATEWKDNTTFTIENDSRLKIQDSYKVSSNDSKYNNVINLYNDIVSVNNDILYLNYTSGYQSFLGIPNITKVSQYMNLKLLDYYRNIESKNLGITVMDFIDENLSESIIYTNFK